MTVLPAIRSVVCRAVAVTLAVVGWSTLPALAGSHETAQPDAPAVMAEPASRAVRITLDEFERFVTEGNVILIDVRPRHAYEQAHLPNAVSMPLEEFDRALARLTAANARIVLYCGGPAGTRSGRAAAMLREHGFDRVYCLDGGFERWVASGRVVIVKPT